MVARDCSYHRANRASDESHKISKDKKSKMESKIGNTSRAVKEYDDYSAPKE